MIRADLYEIPEARDLNDAQNKGRWSERTQPCAVRPHRVDPAIGLIENGPRGVGCSEASRREDCGTQRVDEGEDRGLEAALRLLGGRGRGSVLPHGSQGTLHQAVRRPGRRRSRGGRTLAEALGANVLDEQCAPALPSVERLARQEGTRA